MLVHAFRPRMVCAQRGSSAPDARPNSSRRKPLTAATGVKSILKEKKMKTSILIGAALSVVADFIEDRRPVLRRRRRVGAPLAGGRRDQISRKRNANAEINLAGQKPTHSP